MENFIFCAVKRRFVKLYMVILYNFTHSSKYSVPALNHFKLRPYERFRKKVVYKEKLSSCLRNVRDKFKYISWLIFYM